MGGMVELVKEGKMGFISLSECSAQSLGHGSVVHPLVSLQMVLFSRDAEERRQIDACKELGITMTAYAVLRRGMLSARCPRWKKCQSTTFAPICLALQTANVGSNLRLRPALEPAVLRKNATLVELAWPMAEVCVRMPSPFRYLARNHAST
jgi:aryl-alcohol dehydrogenase-like predicted oxidoreductase